MTKNICESLNLSLIDPNLDRAVKINHRRDVAIYDTLCLYCAENDVDLKNVSDDEFNAAADLISDYKNSLGDEDPEHFYFWIGGVE